MNYNGIGFKPRDDWISRRKDVIRIDVASKIPRRYYKLGAYKINIEKE